MPQTIVNKLSAGRVECLVTFTPEERAPAEKRAIEELGKEVKIDGFRPGKAPADLILGRLNPDAIFEETIRVLLPKTIEEIVTSNDLKPIIHPRVSAESRDPLSIKITFIELPPVTIKGIDKIKVEKKEVKVDEKDIQNMVDYVIREHRSFKEVDRAADANDQVTMNFVGKDTKGVEIAGTRANDHQVIIGSKTLIPGFEDELKGLKKGDKKSFEITFPEKYHAEPLQGAKVTFDIEMNKVEEVQTPELTDEFVKEKLNRESKKVFMDEIESSMKMQEERIEMQRREQQVLDKIKEATKVELPEELVEEEARDLLMELERSIQSQGLTLQDWMARTNKKAEEIHKDMLERAKDRLTLRFGMQKIVEEKGITVTDEEMNQSIEQLLAPLDPKQKEELRPAYEKGNRAYLQMEWQKKIDKVMDLFLQ